MCANNFFQEVEEFRSYIKCKYRIIGRLISIKVLQKFFYLNTPIKGELQTAFIIFQTLYIIIFLVSPHLLMSMLFIDQSYLPIIYLGLKATPLSSQLFQNCFKLAPRQFQLSGVTCQDSSYLTNTLANTNSLLVSDFCHLT